MVISSSLVVNVKRGSPELITPATSTPFEIKELSYLDCHLSAQSQMPGILIYRQGGKNVGSVIRDAISKALVHYYPFAGRLRKGSERILVVECTGEGVMFIEAEANVEMDQLGDLIPPFSNEFLYNGPGLGEILNAPLLMIQVTHLMCGGIVFAVHHNHVMADATGISQFLIAIGEIARSVCALSVQPVWKRELLDPRDPPQVTYEHHVFQEIHETKAVPINTPGHVTQLFFFGPQEIKKLRSHLPPHLRMCSRFELLTAWLWRCRIAALNPAPSETVGTLCFVNVRNILKPPLPSGFYGNAFGLSVARSTAGDLLENPLGYAIQLIKEAKQQVTNEYMRSFIDLSKIRGPSYFKQVWYNVSDIKHAGLNDVDFGWGKPIYAGPAWCEDSSCTYLVRFQNKEGEEGIVASLYLEKTVMDKFAREMEKLREDHYISEL